ncbi:uncharacterized protein LOC114576513 [Exaiptasia diaphana]|uniref:Uncharacterized protein n=1 Tax=Exaiptasia diaphana TaxID=2652724 RepID=A0A913YVJ1_EXADI|nr:uncharacterized protein LOC114576513 [Exaiptasia diaphana]
MRALTISKLNVYKGPVHVTEASNIADHCIHHSLSHDKDHDKFGVACGHPHDHFCLSCEELKTVLDDIKEAITESADSFTSEQHDDIKFLFQQAVSAIGAWKAHQLRSIQQDKARTDLLLKLGPSEVLITQDWAMKFLPQKYRETQTDWFGKRGISWHISVVIRKNQSGDLLHQVYVHVVDQCTQDSSVVISIMEHTLRSIKEEHPEVDTAYYRQDNAGCYHSTELLTACHLMENATGIKVGRVDFSDPQGGKGPCDRKAATIKAHIRRFINEGNDVNTAYDLCQAILSSGSVRGVRVALIDGTKLTPLTSDSKLEGISTLNNFEVTKDGLICWKAYKIGTGKLVSWSSLTARETLNISPINSPLSQGCFTEIRSKKKAASQKEKEIEADSDHYEEDDDDEEMSKLFACPVEGCVKMFQRYASLDNHIQYGTCKLKEEKESLFDKAILKYQDKLQTKSSVPSLAPTQVEKMDDADQAILNRGWALKASKKSSRFSEQQKSFLDEMFFLGQETGHKQDPSTVAQQMRYAKGLDGSRRFQLQEFLSWWFLSPCYWNAVLLVSL